MVEHRCSGLKTQWNIDKVDKRQDETSIWWNLRHGGKLTLWTEDMVEDRHVGLKTW